MVLKSTGGGSGSQAASFSGLATLVANINGAEVTVLNANITNTSRFRSLVPQSLGTVSLPSALGIAERTAGVSFKIRANQLDDTSVVYWEFFEP